MKTKLIKVKDIYLNPLSVKYLEIKKDANGFYCLLEIGTGKLFESGYYKSEMSLGSWINKYFDLTD